MAITDTLTRVGDTQGQFSGTGIVTSTSLGVIATMKVPPGASVAGIQVKNADTSNAFNAFEVSLRASGSADWVVHANTAAQFTTAIKLPLVEASGSPVTLATTGNVLMRYECGGFDAIRVRAAQASAAGTADVYFNYGNSR